MKDWFSDGKIGYFGVLRAVGNTSMRDSLHHELRACEAAQDIKKILIFQSLTI